MALGVEQNLTGDMQHIANHAQAAKASKAVIDLGEQVARPSDEVVGQLRQEHDQVLGGKSAFVPLG